MEMELLLEPDNHCHSKDSEEGTGSSSDKAPFYPAGERASLALTNHSFATGVHENDILLLHRRDRREEIISLWRTK